MSLAWDGYGSRTSIPIYLSRVPYGRYLSTYVGKLAPSIHLPTRSSSIQIWQASCNTMAVFQQASFWASTTMVGRKGHVEALGGGHARVCFTSVLRRPPAQVGKGK